MQRHHRALTEADQRQRRRRQLVPGEFGFEKAFQHRRGLVDANPALVGIAKCQREPLPADRRLTARLGCMRRDEGGVRQQLLPGAADFDQVIAVGAITMQENDELLRCAGARRKPRAIECPDSEVRHHLRRARTNFGIDRGTRKFILVVPLLNPRFA